LSKTQPEWADPGLAHSAYDWPAIADQLRANPNQWLRIYESGSRAVPISIRSGSVKALLPEDGFEVTTRNNVASTKGSPGSCSLFLRYVPPSEWTDAHRKRVEHAVSKRRER